MKQTYHSHYFLAVPLDDKIRKSVSVWQEKIKDAFPFKSWVHPLDLHITLAFLGNVKEEHLQHLQEKMIVASKSHNTFRLEMNHMGTFGEQLSPRILWAGIKKEFKLYELQASVSAVCSQVGIDIEKRPYTPHITIARKWCGHKDFNLSNLPSLSLEHQTFDVNEIHLYKTNMTTIPKYERQATFSLL